MDPWCKSIGLTAPIKLSALEAISHWISISFSHTHAHSMPAHLSVSRSTPSSLFSQQTTTFASTLCLLMEIRSGAWGSWDTAVVLRAPKLIPLDDSYSPLAQNANRSSCGASIHGNNESFLKCSDLTFRIIISRQTFVRTLWRRRRGTKAILRSPARRKIRIFLPANAEFVLLHADAKP